MLPWCTMNNKPLHTQKISPQMLIAKALPGSELARLLEPYLERESLALEDLCKDLAGKQDPLSREEVMVLLLQEYLQRAK